jgi:anti-repressor protein|nr:MAG TPA: KilAC domain protein [Caudoviricetes sp.]
MNELIEVDSDTQMVSARELYGVLEIASRFSRWFDTNKDLFVEGEDYYKCTSSTVVNNGAVRELEDYQISVLMAKHLAMMSRTEKGKKVRDYLIALEKAWNTPEQVMARALRIADRTIDELKLNNQRLVAVNEEMKPKAIFADAVAASHTSILVGELAKILKQNGINIGQNRLYEWLRENGYLIKGNKRTDRNAPTQRSMDMGLFEVKISTVVNSDGSVRETRTTKVTGKGQQYFINKFLAI